MASEPVPPTSSDSPLASGENSRDLSAKAARCRRLAAGISDPQASDVLSQMARGYEEAADRLGKQG